MKIRKQKSHLHHKTLTIFFTTFVALLLAMPAFSGPPHPPGFGVPRPSRHSGPRVRHLPAPHSGVVGRLSPAPFVPVRHLRPVVPYGRVIHTLPEAAFHLSVAGALFYYHMGAYYRQGPNGYIAVNAPIGAVINTLPPGYSSVVHNGVAYYVYGGVYYLPNEQGFMVVADPTGGQNVTTTNINVPAATILPAQVRITSRMLNVRSDPNTASTIVSQLSIGTIVKVTGNVAGWYQVELSDGTSGWVMIRYTSPIMPANG